MDEKEQPSRIHGTSPTTNDLPPPPEVNHKRDLKTQDPLADGQPSPRRYPPPPPIPAKIEAGDELWRTANKLAKTVGLNTSMMSNALDTTLIFVSVSNDRPSQPNPKHRPVSSPGSTPPSSPPPSPPSPVAPAMKPTPSSGYSSPTPPPSPPSSHTPPLPTPCSTTSSSPQASCSASSPPSGPS